MLPYSLSASPVCRTTRTIRGGGFGGAHKEHEYPQVHLYALILFVASKIRLQPCFCRVQLWCSSVYPERRCCEIFDLVEIFSSPAVFFLFVPEVAAIQKGFTLVFFQVF